MQQVHGVAWSPLCSTAFAAVTADGRLDLWDLSESLLDPVATASAECALSSVAFAAIDPVVVAGGQDGAVRVFRVHGHAASAEARGRSAGEQAERLLATVAPKPLAELS